MPTAATTAETKVQEASQHLYEALTRRFGPLDLGADQPLVRAVSEYGQASRAGDDGRINAASALVYTALTRHFGPLDLGAQEPIVRALAEYGTACRVAGRSS